MLYDIPCVLFLFTLTHVPVAVYCYQHTGMMTAGMTRRTQVAATHGSILVDTKYEFGRNETTGEILLIDDDSTWSTTTSMAEILDGTPPSDSGDNAASFGMSLVCIRCFLVVIPCLSFTDKRATKDRQITVKSPLFYLCFMFFFSSCMSCHPSSI